MTRASEMQVPAGDLKREGPEIGADVRAALDRVVSRGWYLMGPELEAFEAEFATWLGVPHAVGVGSGTDALVLALAALGVGAGDEVITTAMTSVATATAIVLAGATPVVVDVDPGTMNLDLGAIRGAVTERTRALMPVHLYGRPVAMPELMAIAGELGLRVVEDACQAHGASLAGRRAGTFGDAGCFSFYPSKNLGAFGDGGMVVTHDASLADRLRLLRQYGWRERDRSEVRGWNSRLDELQSAVLRTKLPHLEAWNRRRAEIAATYDEGLAGLPGLLVPAPDPGHAHHLYVVRNAERDSLRGRLAARGIATGVHYPLPIHRHPALLATFAGQSYPEAERLADTVLSLPLFPQLTDAEAGAVVGALRAELG